jgi:hypothetical protein
MDIVLVISTHTSVRQITSFHNLWFDFLSLIITVIIIHPLWLLYNKIPEVAYFIKKCLFWLIFLAQAKGSLQTLSITWPKTGNIFVYVSSGLFLLCHKTPRIQSWHSTLMTLSNSKLLSKSPTSIHHGQIQILLS